MNSAIPSNSGGGGGGRGQGQPNMNGPDYSSVGMSIVTDSSSGTTGPTKSSNIPTYPMPVYLKFAPGGISFAGTSTRTTTSDDDDATIGAATHMKDDGPYMYNLADYSHAPVLPTIGITAAAASSSSTTSVSSSTSGARQLQQQQQEQVGNSPDSLVTQARLADDRLQAYIRLFVGATSGSTTTTTTTAILPTTTTTSTVDPSYSSSSSVEQGQAAVPPIFLPSLSILANAAFGRLTGVPPSAAKLWADAMVLQYYDDDDDHHSNNSNTHEGTTTTTTWPQTEEEVINMKLGGRGGKGRNGSDGPDGGSSDESTVNLLKRLLLEGQAKEASVAAPSSSTYRPRPCGYVFKRGDIAWNCRTCQTDSTCVICDNCFRQSDHEGHEVYFHRTTPGGCCDCGDVEAWKVEGCCTLHRPRVDACIEVPTVQDDPHEAVRMASRGRQAGIEALRNVPTALPPRLAATLGVVIGAAVHCLVQTVDGAGIGADPTQWKIRWSDEAAKIWNGAPQQEYHHPNRNSHSSAAAAAAAIAGTGSASVPSPTWSTPNDFLRETSPQSFPQNFRLQLRLHNDDVHTFDEVIDALHDPRQHTRRSNLIIADDPISQSLVPIREDATTMTHHVDGDGQVTVKTYSSVASAMIGFRRLKSRGLHCAVVSTAQVDAELRARALSSWLTEISAAHPAAAVLVVHALLQINSSQDLDKVAVWQEARSIPPWVAPAEMDEVVACRRRFQAFPPHLASSYVTSDEAEILFEMALAVNAPALLELTATDPTFYAHVPYRLPIERYRKSPHCLWGTLPSMYNDPVPVAEKHPLLALLTTGQWDAETLSTRNDLTETVYVVDTDLRKQQEADRLTSSVFPHKLPGLHMISGIGKLRANEITQNRPQNPSPMEYRHLLAASSFRAPMSPIILLLLLDPYPTKQVRGAVHALFLSLLTDARFKCRFAAALGIAYRPLSTLFCAGVGTEADTPLGFTVQIFTAGSLVRALGSAPAVEKLLLPDDDSGPGNRESSIGVFTMPIAHTVVRCIHTNLLGATKEVHMILNNTASGNDDDSHENIQSANDGLLPALTYLAGEHPLMILLPAAPDDGFLDSRSTRHKRLPHLLRDLEYVIETPGTAMRLLLPNQFPVYQGAQLSSRGEEILTFCTVWSRLLRLAQGMDPQKRKISGGHVEYEQNRWLEAYGLSLNFAGTRDALAESPTNSSSAALAPVSEDGSHLVSIREAMGNIIASLLREMKFWLYREGMLETGLPVPPGGAHGASDLSQVEALQRSTLHVAGSQLGSTSLSEGPTSSPTNVSTVALSCATSIKMTEAQLDLIESALRLEGAQRQYISGGLRNDGVPSPTNSGNLTSGALMGDWLKVPHSPLSGDSLSFHLPLHRALAKTVRSLCAVVVPESTRTDDGRGWWKLPVLDKAMSTSESNSSNVQHPLVPLIRPILRSSNCRVVWAAGPVCTPQDAQRRHARSRTVSANIAVAKIIHSLADHPIRCLAAAQQIERYLWARNGSSVAGMALNYSNAPLCRSFRDLDLTLVQLSAAGMSVGLGARRVFSLLISRFSLDGYLCDPERRIATSGGGNGSYATGLGTWVNPPRLQDPEHATVLSESLFAMLCILVTELPPPPPLSSSDETWLRQSIRRELIHALAAEPRSHSAAMAAASCVGRRDESDGSAGTSGGGGLFRDVFAQVLKEVGKQKNQGSRAGSGPSSFELNSDCCDEYDPNFFHLRRQEHQHAMDVVASLRKQKLNKERNEKDQNVTADIYCFPLVCQPPRAHPRFISCRLMLHLPLMDAALRRALLFAVGGSWLPPPEPVKKSEKLEDDASPGSAENRSISVSLSTDTGAGDVPVMTFSRRGIQKIQAGVTPSNPLPSRGSSFSEGDPDPSFSSDVVAASSSSILEVLQLLTLQVHTLEECASLHRLQPDLDEEAKSLSAGLSINSYLGRLVRVPESITDVWALRPYPEGPLKSKGSGEKRGSILGLLIAIYEHRADHGAAPSGGGQDDAGDGHGGARALTASGLKWLLRFVNALVDGAPSVGAASKSATIGVPIRNSGTSSLGAEAAGMTIWTIDDTVRFTISNMLSNLPDLWPKPVEGSGDKESSANKEKKERGKAAQQRMLDMMRRKQSAFMTSMGTSEIEGETKASGPDEAEHLCIICRCDDADGENNGPLGFLGHVQRSRVAQMRACCEVDGKSEESESTSLFQMHRVVGHMGCQIRETEAMDSRPVDCLPRGCIVRVRKNTVSDKYDILSRRVFVEHVSEDNGKTTTGWASVQSSQGYVILSPLVPLCYENTRWGSTRPIIRQCGHAAHLKCVETHTLSLHQRAAGEQPYDGRFAANIDDGEFLCPLCKQLSNILIPRDGCARIKGADNAEPVSRTKIQGAESLEETLQNLLTRGTFVGKKEIDAMSDIGQKAFADFGSHLMQAMDVPWERSSGSRRLQLKHRKWHPSIQRWDYEEEDDDIASEAPITVRSVLRLLRQQHIAWAAVGHSAAAAEAAVRGTEDVLPFGIFSKTEDPWLGYENDKDNHPMVLELTRTMTGAAGLLEVLIFEMNVQLSGNSVGLEGTHPSVVAKCLADILCGYAWMVEHKDTIRGRLSTIERDRFALWSEITALSSAMPCHVARDGMLSKRREARAVAAEMWVSRGLGTQGFINGEPPVPLAVNKLFKSGSQRPPDISRHWGSLSPTANEDSPLHVPFRPAVATAFLYAPLLAWDLNTLAGAVFSSILVNDSELPSSEEILSCARLLIAGRTIQALITPHGFDSVDDLEIDEEDEEGIWSPSEVQAEGDSLANLYSHCKARVETESFGQAPGVKQASLVGSTANLFASVGRAILPFSRSVILMMRACNAAVKARYRLKGSAVDAFDADSAKVLDSVLDGSEIMTTSDGFFILKQMKGPMPSAMIDESGMWWNLVNRWLTAVIGLERHHGSRGKSVLTDLFPPAGAKLNVDEDYKMTNADPHVGVPKKDTVEARTKQDSSLSDSVASISKDESHPFSETENAEFGEDHSDDGNPMQRHLFNENLGEESDEELLEDMEIDEADEMIDFVDNNAGVPGVASANDGDESADELSSSGSDEGEFNSPDQPFAGVAHAPIISYQPSLLAQQPIGPGKVGSIIEAATASGVMADLSHLGLIHRKDSPTFSLIRLPKSFVELYGIVNKVKGRDESTALDDSDDIGNSETAICLLTGAVMRSGSTRHRSYQRVGARPPGACTIHARKNGSGIGIFFLVQKCTVLLMHNNKSAYSASLYVDEHGEEDPGLRRGRPLFLNETRYRALEQQWRQQWIPREVAQIRSTSDRVIRDNWY